MPSTLTIGSHGAEVTFLQRMLNKRGANPYLAEDGSFGSNTRAALVAFQRTARLASADGIAGPLTWQAFGRIAEIHHRVTPFGQPSDMSCWSAAATIIFGDRSVGPGRASLTNTGGLGAGIDNVETFISGLGWRLVNNMTAPPVSMLVSAMHRGPAWVAFQGVNFGHAVVFNGVLSDGAPDGTGTVFRVTDPWPPRVGTSYGTTYLGQTVWLRSVRPARPAMIAYVAQR